jgi:hypothetical protein
MTSELTTVHVLMQSLKEWRFGGRAPWTLFFDIFFFEIGILKCQNSEKKMSHVDNDDFYLCAKKSMRNIMYSGLCKNDNF